MPSGKNAWSLFVTFDLFVILTILHVLLIAAMTDILLVERLSSGDRLSK